MTLKNLNQKDTTRKNPPLQGNGEREEEKADEMAIDSGGVFDTVFIEARVER
jgi:hypothetical protein